MRTQLKFDIIAVFPCTRYYMSGACTEGSHCPFSHNSKKSNPDMVRVKSRLIIATCTLIVSIPPITPLTRHVVTTCKAVARTAKAVVTITSDPNRRRKQGLTSWGVHVTVHECCVEV